MQNNKGRNCIIDFLDSIEMNFSEKQKNATKNQSTYDIFNYEWLQKWVKKENVFNKYFYDEANEKVNQVILKFEEQGYSEEEIDEMISRIDCFAETVNDVDRTSNFILGTTGWVVSALLGAFTTLLANLFQNVKDTSLPDSCGVLAVSIVILIGLCCILHYTYRKVQIKVYRQAVLNLLREKLVKKKEEIKNRKE